MAGPWERFAPAAEPTSQDGPWARFAAAPEEPAPAAAPVMVQSYDALGNPTGYVEVAPPPSTSTYGEQMRNVTAAADDTARMVLKGALMGTNDKLVAGVATGGGLLGDYDARLASERARTKEIETNHPIAAGLATGLGGVVGMGAASAAGLPVFGGAGALGARMLRGGTSMLGLGLASGLTKADGDLAERYEQAKPEALLGAAVGAGGPLLGAGLARGYEYLRRPIVARAAPDRYVMGQIGAALESAGRTPEQIEAALAQAAVEGQPQYAVADALGTEGRRLLTTVTKQPGPGREAATELLEQRQAGQARRLSNFLDEGFGTGGRTAEQTEAALTAARDAEADVSYRAAREGARPVDVTPAIERADETLRPGVSALADPGAGFAPNTIESAVADARALIAGEHGSQKFDFEAVLNAKKNIDGWIGTNERSGNNSVVGALKGIQRELDDALAQASNRYGAARDTFARQSREIDAIDTGRQAAARGRTEDTIQGFNALEPGAQQSFRAGYADTYIADAQKAAQGANVARPLTSDAVRAEFPAFAAPGQGERLMSRIGRENEMFATRQAATGGSSTVENLNDQAGAVRRSLIIRALKNPTGAAGEALEALGVSPTTAETRRILGQVLLSGDGASLREAVVTARAQQEAREAMARRLGRALAGGGGAIVRANR